MNENIKIKQIKSFLNLAIRLEAKPTIELNEAQYLLDYINEINKRNASLQYALCAVREKWNNDKARYRRKAHKYRQELRELELIVGLRQKRNLISKFDKEYDEEDKKKNPNRDYAAISPDAEEVYKRYYDLKNKIDKAREIAKSNSGECIYCETIEEILGEEE